MITKFNKVNVYKIDVIMVIFSISGYTNARTFVKIDERKIHEVEEWVRTELIDLIPDFFLDDENVAQYFGSYKTQPNQFKFQDREKNLIIHMRNHIDFMFDPDNLLKEMSDLHLTTSHASCGNKEGCLIDDEFADIIPFEIPETHTHIILKTFLETANSNALTKQGGYRYSESTKRFATFFRILAGPKAYLAVQKNMEIALPSLTSVNRYVHKTRTRITEGILRDNELLHYLQDRKLPLAVTLAEDSTDIENYVRFDPQNNICVGFVLPINKRTGMPVPFKYRARSAEEIVGHFYGAKTATQVTTVMARPIAADIAPFCLLVFGTDNTNKTKDVVNRWNYVSQQLKRLNIDAMTFSSDSDPKYNSAMRIMTTLSTDSTIFGNVEWFNCGDIQDPPFFVQDTPHIGTKGRNIFLKTGSKPEKLPFGKYFINVAHLHQLAEQFDKDKHRLTATILNAKDRQNYDSVLKICSPDVIEMMKLNVPNSNGTAMYLQLLRNFIDSFMDTDLSPIDRVYKLWYSIFVIRIWRLSIVHNESLSLQKNFLTNYTYVCLELNAHSMVLILIYLKKHNFPHLFMPWLYNSQSCENFYRLVRSLTTVFARAANCSVKDVLERIHKIQLLADITNDSDTKFTYLKKKQPIKSEINLLPTKSEIKDMIEKSKIKAIEDAFEIGLLDEINLDLGLKCEILPLTSAKKQQKNLKVSKNMKCALLNDNIVKTSLKLSGLMTISLKNFSYKFTDKDVDETSSYVEIPGCNNRMIVKKTSLIWLMRQDPCKLSSDRLQRVKKTTKIHLLTYTDHVHDRKKNKKILHFSKCTQFKQKKKRQTS